MMFCTLGALAVSGIPPPIILPALGGKAGRPTLLLLVPSTEPKQYISVSKAVQEAASMPLSVGIAVCSEPVHPLNATLCDPIFTLPKVLKNIIALANHTAGGVLRPSDIFVGGHAVGAMEARRFVDLEYKNAGGLIMWGSQYNGDSDNLMGFLGYPLNVTTYPTPLLAVSGELDKFGVSPVAVFADHCKSLPATKRHRIFPVLIPGLDQSMFANAYQGPQDLLPEITQAAAISAISQDGKGVG